MSKIGRRTVQFLVACLLLALPAGRARAQEVFAIDQRFGNIVFSVSHMGLFSSQGGFRTWHGDLTIDAAEPAKTQIAVVIDTTSLTMPWANEVTMLDSPPYFDVAEYKQARFTSTLVAADGPGKFTIAGQLEMRGVARPIVLHAALVGRHPGTQPGVEVAEFVVTGNLLRSAYGMTADPTFISDTVQLTIHARVLLTAAAHAG